MKNWRAHCCYWWEIKVLKTPQIHFWMDNSSEVDSRGLSNECNRHSQTLRQKKNDLLQIKNAGTNTFAKMLYATMSYAGIYDTRSNFFEDRVQDRG